MEVVDTFDKANEQQSTVQHHAQMPELNVRRCFCRSPASDGTKNSSLSVAGVSPMQLVFGRNPEISGDFLCDNTTNQFSMTEMLDSSREQRTLPVQDDCSCGQNARKVSSAHATAGGADFLLW